MAYTFKHIGLATYTSETYVPVNGKAFRVAFMAGSEGTGKARVWHVIASHFDGEKITKQTAFANSRDEAADLALKALLAA